MSEFPSTEDIAITSPLAQADDESSSCLVSDPPQTDTISDQNIANSSPPEQQVYATETNTFQNNGQIDEQRKEIIDSYSSTVANAQNRYPDELQELKKLREEHYPQHVSEQAKRQESLDQNSVQVQSAEEEEKALNEQKTKKEEELESIKSTRVVLFRGKKIANTEEEIEQLSVRLSQIAERKNSAQSASNILERDISARPELQPLEKRFKELVPLFQTDLMTPEEKEVVFDEEFLTTLSLEEYLEVWRLGSPHYVAHVTRQGYRDHFRQDMSPKGSNVGVHYNGFKGMLEDGKKCRSTVSVLFGTDLENGTFDNEKVTGAVVEIDKTYTKEAVLNEWLTQYIEGRGFFAMDAISQEDAQEIEERVLHDMSKENFEEIRRQQIVNWSISKLFDPDKPDFITHIPFVLDKSAIHLSSDEILNEIYGGESGNEIFVIYPTDMIASQYIFGVSDLKNDITEKPHGSENKWNDIFVWNDNQAISMDAGIVFLPSNAKVDPQTGSKYKDGQFLSPEETISSREYWDRYFEENPDKKPKHLVYYDREDSPTKAANKFLSEQGIVKIKPQQKNLGFEKNRVARKRYNLGNERMRRFRESTKKIYEGIKPVVARVNQESYRGDPITEEDMRKAIRERIKKLY
jgi:hypothetical protein